MDWKLENGNAYVIATKNKQVDRFYKEEDIPFRCSYSKGKGMLMCSWKNATRFTSIEDAKAHLDKAKKRHPNVEFIIVKVTTLFDEIKI